MEQDMSAVELSSFLESCVPPFERFQEYANCYVKFKNHHTRMMFGDKWLHGTVVAVEPTYILIAGIKYNYDDLEVRHDQGEHGGWGYPR